MQVRDLPAVSVPQIYEPRPVRLPPFDHAISRPSSAASSRSQSSNSGIRLPALSTLASLATSDANRPSLTRSHSASEQAIMAFARVPTPTPSISLPALSPSASGSVPNGIPACANCGTNTTPLWRRDEQGSVLCNACGLFLKLHGKPRPISLKTDVIKSRNRVKASAQGVKRPRTENTSLAASHPDADPAQLAAINQRRASQQAPGQTNGHDRSTSPASRSGTPGLHNPNIAPQHVFDGVAFDGQTSYGQTMPFFQRQPSPGSVSSVNGSHLEPPATFDALLALNNTLKTRVSELEVINDLFRGRVQELEVSEREARDAESRLKHELEEALARESDLRKVLEEVGADSPRIGSATKRLRLSDVVDETQAATPMSTRSHST